MNIIRPFLYIMAVFVGLSFMSGQNSVWAKEFALSEATHKRLTVIHRLMEKENYQKALKQLGALYGRVKKRDHERALVLQTYGYIYAEQHNWPKAIDSFEKCLAIGAMPKLAEQAILFNLAQLYGAAKKFKLAVRTFEEWMSKEKKVSASQHVFGGRLYAEAKHYESAIKHFQTAIANTTSPNEEWYRGLLAVFYQSKRHQQAAKLLEKMLGFFPENKSYWNQLSNTYYLLNNPKKSVALMEVMRLKGFLTEQEQLLRLANFYLYTNLPYKAAALLETAMNDGKIDANRTNLRLLSDSYFSASEVEKSEQVLLRAAARWKDPELYLRIARLQLNQEKWNDAASSIKSAVDIGGLKQPGQAYLLQGIAFYQRDDHRKALAAFKRARQETSTKEHAVQWINFLSGQTPVSH